MYREIKRVYILAVFVLLVIAFVGCQRQEDRLTLSLNGERKICLEYGTVYQEPGAAAKYGDTEVSVTVTGAVDTSKVGSYTVAYLAEYEDRVTTAYRKVTVVDTQAPVITLVTKPGHYTVPGTTYEEEGFSAQDHYDGDLTGQVRRKVTVDQVIYTVSDASGNVTTVTRDIYYDDPIAPELTLKGGQSITVTAGESFVDPGYTALDNCDGDITGAVTVTGTVDIWIPGTYTLTYTVSDTYENTVSASREVQVKPRPVPDTVSPNGKVIYLTFDDGPGRYTEELLEILDKYQVKATFFVVNTDYAYLIPSIYEKGHTVGIHTATHVFSQVYKSEEAYFADLYQMRDVIYSYTGKAPDILRFPGGSSNTISRFNPGIMTRLVQAVKAQGYQYFDWNVDSDDAGGATTSQKVYQNVVNGIQGKDIAVVLMHDIKGYSVDAVESIIRWGLENGYTFLPLQADSPNCHHPVMN